MGPYEAKNKQDALQVEKTFLDLVICALLKTHDTPDKPET